MSNYELKQFLNTQMEKLGVKDWRAENVKCKKKRKEKLSPKIEKW